MHDLDHYSDEDCRVDLPLKYGRYNNMATVAKKMKWGLVIVGLISHTSGKSYHFFMRLTSINFLEFYPKIYDQQWIVIVQTYTCQHNIKTFEIRKYVIVTTCKLTG